MRVESEARNLLEKQDWGGLLEWAERQLKAGQNVAQALKISGISHAARGQIALALDCLTKADELLKTDPDVVANLGVLHHNAGLLTDAEVYYRRAAILCPNQVRTHTNLAELYNDMKQYGLAVKSYEDALKISSNDVKVVYNLGVCYQKNSQPFNALNLYTQALEREENAQIRVMRANINKEIGENALARNDYEKVLKDDRENVEALLGIANLHLESRQYSLALDCAKRLEKLQPKNYLVLSLLSSTLREVGSFVKALSYLERAVANQPANLQLQNNLANLLQDMGEHGRAEKILRQVVDASPRFLEAYSNLIFSFQLHKDQLSQSDLKLISGYGDLLANDRVTAETDLGVKTPGIKKTKIRLGFVTGDFRNHPVGYFIEPLLKELKNLNYSLYGFSTHPLEDAQTKRLKGYLDGWVPLYGFDDKGAYGAIKTRSIDVLFDLSGHTAHNRLSVFALRPADIQVAYLGYSGTTGLSSMDYLIASKNSISEDEAVNYSEKIIALDCSHLVYRPPTLAEINATPPFERNGHITYGVFNRANKFNGALLGVWGRILRENIESKILFVGKGFGDPEFVSLFVRKMGQFGVHRHQMSFRGQVSLPDYFELFNSVDISLDTFPFPGGTTTLDSLLMGVPVVSKRGSTFIGRQGELILNTSNLQGWLASDDQAYVNIALGAGDRKDELRLLRRTLREEIMASQLYDSSRLGFEFDRFLRKICRVVH